MRWPLAGRRERARRQASDWIARLNGPHDERDRAAFAAWYAARPDNAAAYERLSALFALAGQARPVPGPTDARAAARGHRGPVRYALAAAATIAVALLAFALLGARGTAPPPEAGARSAVLVAAAGESRHVALADGSEVVLGPGSELAVAIDGAARRLRLTRGEGAFTVFHDSRPFVVVAGGTEVVARGTRFVVRLGADGTLVSLIEGRVEVSYPAVPGQGARLRTSLAPGERLVVPAEAAAPAMPAGDREGARDRAMIELDDTPLAEALAQVNRDGRPPVRLAGPELAGLRITGAFRRGDGEGFARAAAAALDLEVRRGSDGTLWLDARRPGR